MHRCDETGELQIMAKSTKWSCRKMPDYGCDEEKMWMTVVPMVILVEENWEGLATNQFSFELLGNGNM